MNFFQRIILLGYALATLLIGLTPPWERVYLLPSESSGKMSAVAMIRPAEYAPIGHPPEFGTPLENLNPKVGTSMRMDMKRLGVELVTATLVCGALLLAFKSKKRKGSPAEAKNAASAG